MNTAMLLSTKSSNSESAFIFLLKKFTFWQIVNFQKQEKLNNSAAKHFSEKIKALS